MKSFDIISFLRKFYGITSENLSFDTLVHNDISKLFPFIRTSPFENEELLKGNIIMVYDKTGKIMYYDNPHLMIDYVFEKEELCHKNDYTINDIDLNVLSKDELLKIRRKLRLRGLFKDAKMLTKIIHKKKKEEPKEYREKREKIKIKESYYD